MLRCLLRHNRSRPYNRSLIWCHVRTLSFVTPAASERVIVPCNGNGEISLDIHHPTSAPSPSAGPTNVALYLPRGPILHNSEDDLANALSLRSALPFTVVQVNYRIGSQHPYPTPVHDVLAGYDWIHEHLLPKRAISRPRRSDHLGQIAVFGELVGGSLATMLALTECRRTEAGVVAAAVSNPLVDWVFPEADGTPSYEKTSFARFGDKHAGLSLVELFRHRHQLFKKPDAAFDAFASPILFFRTSGVEPPRPLAISALDELEQLSLIDREDFFREQMLLSGISPETPSPPVTHDGPATKKKASRLFPSKAFNLNLPSFHICTSTTTPLDDAFKEFPQALRKSMIRQHRARRPSTFGQKVLLDDEVGEASEEQQSSKAEGEAEADEKVKHHVHEGLALWDQTTAGQKRIEAAAEWVKEKLR